ncbi:3-deoxy-D-manno-octulosonic acid transferase [Palleronia sp. KMU-117]|uniref:3-deoxy-D-manno-octulosonic acid transferase n=1 Tax=Palleronia sp. KMU-117 TaxID=3434108 RepID=UPI003D74AC69
MSVRMRLFLGLWSFLWTVGMPFVLLYLRRRGRKDELYAAHLDERFGRYDQTLPGAVWVHAVSLGEMRSAVPLIRALLDRGERVVVTLFTPAGRREAERVFAADIDTGRLAAVWVPFETGAAYRRFLDAFRPQYGLVMEIEIWPRMVQAARAAGVPLFMCNAQYPTKSIARDSRWPRLRQEVMRGFAGAFVKSDLQAERFAAIGVPNIHVTGELRFDQPIPPVLLDAGRAARDWIGARDRRVITIASAVEGEDPVYLDMIRALRDGGGVPPLFIYVPRRPERFDEVAGFLEAAGLSVLRRSRALGETLGVPIDAPAPVAVPDIFLGDSLGEMYFYLAMADAVVVGGGFTPHGAHNIIEPLAVGKPVVTGPEVGTIEYPFVEAEAAGVAWRVRDAADLAGAVRGLSPDTQAIERFLADHAGGVRRLLAALPDALATARGA